MFALQMFASLIDAEAPAAEAYWCEPAETLKEATAAAISLATDAITEGITDAGDELGSGRAGKSFRRLASSLRTALGWVV